MVHIHALTAQEAGEYVPVQAEQLPAKLEQAAAVLEEKVEAFTEQLAQTSDAATRKTLRKERSR